jgi:hypothetical protein
MLRDVSSVGVNRCYFNLSCVHSSILPVPLSPRDEVQYCEIRKEVALLYFGLDVFCQFEARFPESVQCTLYRGEGRGCVSNSGTLA